MDAGAEESQEAMMAVKFDDFERKSGDLFLIQTRHDKLYVAEAVEKVGNYYRGYFRFVEDRKVFDSSVNCTEAEIKQVIRNGIAVWFNRG